MGVNFEIHVSISLMPILKRNVKRINSQTVPSTSVTIQPVLKTNIFHLHKHDVREKINRLNLLCVPGQTLVLAACPGSERLGLFLFLLRNSSTGSRAQGINGKERNGNIIRPCREMRLPQGVTFISPTAID